LETKRGKKRHTATSGGDLGFSSGANPGRTIWGKPINSQGITKDLKA